MNGSFFDKLKVDPNSKKFAAGLAGTATANITSLPDRDLLQNVAVPAKPAAKEASRVFFTAAGAAAYPFTHTWRV